MFFARLADFGLKDVHALSSDEAHVQTLRHRNSKIPWHNDYLFVSTKLAARIKGYSVVDNEDVRKFSDHNIVVIDIEL